MRHVSRSVPLIEKKFKKTIQKPVPKKERAILISRNTGGIGDLLMITPVIHQVKKNNPDIPIIVCTTPHYNRGVLFDVLRNNPDIYKIITVNELLDYEFVKSYNFNTQEELKYEKPGMIKNRIDTFSEIAGIEIEDKNPVYVVSPQEKIWADKWVNENIPEDRRRIIGMQTSSTTARRNWPMEKQMLFALTVTNRWPVSVLFFNDGVVDLDPTKFPNIHKLVLPFRQAASLINKCEILILPDSGLLHLAGALKKRTIALFGSAHPDSRINYYQNMDGVYLDYPCSPCWYEKCEVQFKCMNDISVDSVINKIEGKNMFPETREIKKVMFVRMGGIGDLIMLGNSLAEFKRVNPGITVILATKTDHIEVLKGAPFLDEVIDIKDSYMNMDGVDKVIDLRYKVESPELGGSLPTEIYTTVNRVEVFESIINVKPEHKTFYVNISEDIVSKIKEQIQYDTNVKYFGIQATCTSNTRTFPPEYLLEISQRFSKYGKVVLFGRTEFWRARPQKVIIKEITGENIINLIDRTGIDELEEIISIMDYIIAPDSSGVHIAAALNKPCLAVFGNIDPKTRIPDYPTVTALYPEGELDCIPCWDFTNPCIHHDLIGAECMRLLTPERIFEAGKEWFKL